MESDPEEDDDPIEDVDPEDDESNQDGLTTQPKSKKSHVLDDEEELSDVSHEQSEDGDDEEDISEHDEELMNLDPKALKDKIASEVRQILKYMFMI